MQDVKDLERGFQEWQKGQGTSLDQLEAGFLKWRAEQHAPGMGYNTLRTIEGLGTGIAQGASDLVTGIPELALRTVVERPTQITRAEARLEHLRRMQKESQAKSSGVPSSIAELVGPIHTSQIGQAPEIVDYDREISRAKKELEYWKANPEQGNAPMRIVPRINMREVFGTWGDSARAVFKGTSREEEQEKRQVHERVIEQVSPGTVMAYEAAHGAGQLLEFIFGPSAVSLRVAERIPAWALRGAEKYGKTAAFAQKSATTAVGLGAVEYAKTQDPVHAAEMAALAPAFVLTGVIGEGPIKKFISAMGAKGATLKGGQMLAEGGLFAILPETEALAISGALKASGLTEYDLLHHASTLIALHDFAFKDMTPEESKKAWQAVIQAGANTLAMGGAGAASAKFPSKAPWYRMQNPEIVRQETQKSAKKALDKINKKDAERETPPEEKAELPERSEDLIETGHRPHAKKGGGAKWQKKGWKPVDLPEGKEGQAQLDLHLRKARLANTMARLLLNVEGVTEAGSDPGVFRYESPKGERGWVTVNEHGKPVIRLDGQNQRWQLWELPGEPAGSQAMSREEVALISYWNDAMRKTLPPDVHAEWNIMADWAAGRAKSDNAMYQQWLQVLADPNSQHLAAKDPVHFIKTLSEMVSTGNAADAMKRLAERPQAMEAAKPEKEVAVDPSLAEKPRGPEAKEGPKKPASEPIRDVEAKSKKDKEPRTSGDKMHLINPDVRALLEATESLKRTVKESVAGFPRTGHEKAAQEFAVTRDRAIRAGEHRHHRLFKKWKKRFPKKQQREDLTALIEKTGNPMVKGDTYAKVLERATPEMKEAVKEIKQRTDKVHQELVDSGILDKDAYLENYITHFWEKPKKMEESQFREVVGNLKKSLSTNVPFAKKRSIATIEAGVKEGLVPKTVDAVEILRRMEDMALVARENKLLVKNLRKAGLAANKSKAPPEYESVDHPAFRVKYAVKQLRKTKKGKEKVVHEARVENVVVHPSIKRVIHAVTEAGFHMPSVVRASYAIGSVMKSFGFMASAFHPFALIESVFQSGPARLWRPITGFVDVFKGLFGEGKLVDTEMGEHAIARGLDVGAPSDLARRHLDRYLDSYITKMRLSDNPISKVWMGSAMGVKAFQDFTSYILWDVMHPRFKMMVWRQLSQDIISREAKDLTGVELMKKVREVEEAVAKDVNDRFGGQPWGEHFGGLRGERRQQFLRASMFSHDWTISVAKTFAKSLYAMSFADKSMLAKARRAYAFNTAVMMTIGLQAAQWAWANLTFSDDEWKALEDEGTSLWIWDNPPDDKMFGIPTLGLRTGKDEATGRWKFAIPFKQVRENVRWFVDPIEIAGAKVSPLIKQVVKMGAGHDLGSGLPAPWVISGAEGLEKYGMMGLDFLANFVPLSARGNSWKLTLPERDGMTPYRTRRFMIHALEAYADPTHKRLLGLQNKPLSPEEVMDELDYYIKHARANNIDYHAAFRTALSKVRTEAYAGLAKALSVGDIKKAERYAEMMSRLNTDRRHAKDVLSRRFVKMLDAGEILFTPDELRQMSIDGARMIDPSQGLPIRRKGRQIKGQRRREEAEKR